jgi:uncharacterized protein (TIGR02147 family)
VSTVRDMAKEMVKSIFEYDNYREFLKDVYLSLKATDKKFSFRYFSKAAGFKAGNVLKFAMDGKRNIAPQSIEKFAKALKLNKEESLFFRHLVLFNQAKAIDQRQLHLKEMLRCRAFKKVYPLSASQFNYYQHWYYISIRELIGLEGFREDYDWISKTLEPAITPQAAKRAVDDLIELGLIQRKSDGRLYQVDTDITTGNEVTSQALANYHREMIKKGAESIERFRREMRDVSAVTVAVSPESIKTIKEMVQRFRKEIVEFSLKTGHPSIIYQVNFQIFPITRIVETEKK